MQHVNEQYETKENLESRIGIYHLSTADMTFHEWISTLIPRQNRIRVLELGCGTGILWKYLYPNFQDSVIILSDTSENMIKESEKNLKGLNIEFEVIDYNNIPYPPESFDLIISNHNLYHADDLSIALGEIRRVLKSNGTFICSTNSRNHLIELKEVLFRYGIKNFWPNENLIDNFGMENGESKLSGYFSTVSSYQYKNLLHITDPEIVIQYYLSLGDEKMKKTIGEKKDFMIKDIQSEIDSGIFFKVHARPGLFICHK